MLSLGGLHVKQTVQRGIWVPTQNILQDREKALKTLNRMDRSHDLQDANWLLSRSPASNTRTVILVEVEVNLRPTVSRPVCLGVRHPSGTRDQFFFLLGISFRQLRLYFVVPSLTRKRVCNFLYNWFWALPEQSLLGRSPAELTAILYCLIWDSPNLSEKVRVTLQLTVSQSVCLGVEPPTWRTRSPYLYLPGTGWPSYTPGHWVPFWSPLMTGRAMVDVFYSAPTRVEILVGVGVRLPPTDSRPVRLGIGPPFGAHDQISSLSFIKILCKTFSSYLKETLGL
jgi:hypothetical protein